MSNAYIQNTITSASHGKTLGKHAKRKYVKKLLEGNVYSGNVYDATSYYIAAAFQKSSRFPESKEKNRVKHIIAEIANLKRNWNGNDAEPISRNILLKAFELIDLLPAIPDVFPTACGTIQYEYEKETGEYLELELQDDGVKVFSIDSANAESTLMISYDDWEKLKIMVEAFDE